MFDHQVSTNKSTNVRAIYFRWFNSILSRVAPPVATRLAAWMFTTPMGVRSPARESRWSEDAVRTTIPSPLGPIPVWAWGHGPETVLLVHGWSGRGLQMGALAEPLVTRGFRVVAFDAPGHGEAGGRSSSLPAFAAALGAVARRFGPVSAVVAHSLGCAAAVFALSQRELLCERFVAISPAARLHAIREGFGEMIGATPSVVDRMKMLFERRFGFDWDASEPLRLAPTMTMPLQVIHDAGDRFIPHEEGAELADAWSDGRLITTTGLGHHRILRDPKVIDSVAGFISESAADARMERRTS